MKLSHFVISSGIFRSLPYKDTHLEPEHRLWRAVLDQACHDIAIKRRPRDVAEALFFFSDVDDEGFQDICYAAGLDHVWVHHIFHTRLRKALEANIDIPIKKDTNRHIHNVEILIDSLNE